jgi:vacuolar protein sorting-associated protein 13A/C
MDMNAPVIIIPEEYVFAHFMSFLRYCIDVYSSITTGKCKHLVIDAGHIAIRSDLAPESVVREVQSKRNQKLDAEDQKRLDSLMYDRMSLRLADAQVFALFMILAGHFI